MSSCSPPSCRCSIIVERRSCKRKCPCWSHPSEAPDGITDSTSSNHLLFRQRIKNSRGPSVGFAVSTLYRFEVES
ncbi:unnamed protein product [Pseudo-nitzschia multistriata]|uniref:Uncharacterized protein n=1 Tax=Pseudo-nitzschia multistriata TaxID=183589 RepID=A0A448ZFM2_9STRA|nr:unnamed protein product [Pseudo-nitzschia multistriata]